MENGNLQEYYLKYKLDWNKKFEIAIDICRGMAYLNAVNILHNDIRGKNILIDRNHKAKIANIVFKSNYASCDGRIQLDFFEKIAEEEIPYTREKLDFPTILNRVVKDNYREPFSKNVPKVWQDIANEGVVTFPSSNFDYLYKKCDMNSNDNFELIDCFDLFDYDNDCDYDRMEDEPEKRRVSCEENLKIAAKLYKEAADHGNVEAQLQYGLCLWQGKGVQTDWNESIKYLTLAADNGNSIAMYNVGCALWLVQLNCENSSLALDIT
ncbi:4001_t:CDS:2 [Dentiscutata erythropus]|uniref:4001_t:CDS:1 n=1 Tax=Dentiscutata erythropus TaxID=1348616 RepID=A0A9N8VAR2_9GLOM|nr:4001_t:CDS:2 [Dentiscutata erythropus]